MTVGRLVYGQWTNHANGEEKLICDTKTPLLDYELLVVLHSQTLVYLASCAIVVNFMGSS